jgi:hypothetical protein
MGRVGLIDITVGNAARLGVSQRSTTRRCASHHIATQRASRWGHPGGSRAFGADGPPHARKRLREGMASEGDAAQRVPTRLNSLCARMTILPKTRILVTIIHTRAMTSNDLCVPKTASGMAAWRKSLFAMMHLNANLPAAYFGVPPAQVVEVGLEVKI